MNQEHIAMAIQIAQALGSGGAAEARPAQAQALGHPLVGRHVVVRDDKAGVYAGTLATIDVAGGTAELSSARQIWYWTGAAATPGIAAHGVGPGSKIGPVVESIVCCDVVSVVPMTTKAQACVMDYEEWAP